MAEQKKKKVKHAKQVKKRMILKNKQLFAVLLALALLVAAIPLPHQVQAAPVSDEPIRWRVLSTDSEATGYDSGGMLLMSDTALDVQPFDRDFTTNQWENSSLKQWLRDIFLPTAFSAGEQSAIASSSKTETETEDRVYNSGRSYYLGESSVDEEKLFVPSASEVTNPGYGFTMDDFGGADSSTRQLTATGYAVEQGRVAGDEAGVEDGSATDGGIAIWWLRSPSSRPGNHAGIVYYGGHLTNYYLERLSAAVVPAFNVDLSSVIFASAAYGSKSISLTEPGDYSGSDWRLTIEDTTQSVEVGEGVTLSEGTLTIPYTFTEGVGGGFAAKLSVMITNRRIYTAGAEILYYGQVQDLVYTGVGEVQVTVPEAVRTGGGCVYIFSETNYGAKMTDYASAPVLAKTFPGPGAEASGGVKDVMLGIQGIHNPQEPSDHDAPWGNGAGSYVWLGTYEQDNVENPLPSPIPTEKPIATPSPIPTATPIPSATASPTPSTAVTPTVKPTPTTPPAKKFTVTYQANGGKIGMASKVTKTVTYGKKYVVPAIPKRTNYTFKGWYTAKTGGTKVTKNSTVKLTKNQTLYAQWVVGTAPVFCLYNPNSGEHFYTITASERDEVVAAGWKYEGISWIAALDGHPVFRVYNTVTREHIFSMDTRERARLLALGWKDEGIGFYSDVERKNEILRCYNPNGEPAAQHHYTLSKSERDNLVKAGWIYEGMAWFAK
ncbi:MAG: InlB B-repeat-containing protein [Lachnospiraceae bacterium]